MHSRNRRNRRCWSDPFIYGLRPENQEKLKKDGVGLLEGGFEFGSLGCIAFSISSKHISKTRSTFAFDFAEVSIQRKPRSSANFLASSADTSRRLELLISSV